MIYIQQRGTRHVYHIIEDLWQPHFLCGMPTGNLHRCNCYGERDLPETAVVCTQCHEAQTPAAGVGTSEPEA